jgi:beta-1,4-N-acetylglucosaminyltransferase
MIFVTVGLHYQGFDRLIMKMDALAGMIDEEVVMQIGSTKYKPENAKYFDFVDNDEDILRLFKEARIIISHAGAGTLLNALNFRKPIIVVPRQKVFGEHVDDQQLELTKVLSEDGRVIPVYDIEDLEPALRNIGTANSACLGKSTDLVAFLKRQLMEG